MAAGLSCVPSTVPSLDFSVAIYEYYAAQSNGRRYFYSALTTAPGDPLSTPLCLRFRGCSQSVWTDPVWIRGPVAFYAFTASGSGMDGSVPIYQYTIRLF